MLAVGPDSNWSPWESLTSFIATWSVRETYLQELNWLVTLKKKEIHNLIYPTNQKNLIQQPTAMLYFSPKKII